jgi:hypothetical protein
LPSRAEVAEAISPRKEPEPSPPEPAEEFFPMYARNPEAPKP